MIASLTPVDWVMLLIGAGLVGFAKTAIGGAGSLAVVLFALALPAKQSTGAILPLLIAGDLVAVTGYHRHASWPTLARIVPAVVPGLLLGAWFLGRVDNHTMEITIGVILLLLTGTQLVQRVTRKDQLVSPSHPHLLLTLLAGLAAGFTTMTANAGGPVVTVYLIVAGLPMLQMLGTGAWFFLVVNLLKVPLSASLQLITWHSLALDVALVPPMLVGAFVGFFGIKKMRQQHFELAALSLGFVAAGLLVVA